MPRGFRYSLTFRVQADIRPAVQSMRRLEQEMQRRIGVGGAARRGRAEQQEAAAIGGTTDALKKKGRAQMGLTQVMARGLKVYWSIVSVFYLLRNVIGGVINFYRTLFGVVQKGIGILLGLGRAIVQNAADFEMLRVKMQAIAPTAEMGLRAFEKLKRWVIGMPFTLKEAADAFTYLEATGVRASMGLFRSMRVAATMAKVMDRDLKSASLAIAKFAAGYMQRLTRGFAITPAQLIPYGAVAGDKPGTLEYKAPGATQANVEALYRFVESKWGTVLDRMRNTWEQLVNDMTDIWQQFMDAIGQAGLLNSLKNLLRYIRDIYEVLRDKGVIDEWTQAISDAWSPVVDAMGPLLDRLPSLVETVVNWVVTLGDRTSAWLDSMGGAEGAWERIVASFQKNAPAILEILRTYANIMISIGRAVTATAGGLGMGASIWYALTGQDEKYKAMDLKLRGIGTAFRAQGAAGDKLNEMVDAAISGVAGFDVKKFGGLPGFKLYGWSAEAADTPGGEARDAVDALTKMDEAVKAGAKEGVAEGLIEVFGKAAAERAGKEFNPFVALYEAMMGRGARRARGSVTAYRPPPTPEEYGAAGLERLKALGFGGDVGAAVGEGAGRRKPIRALQPGPVTWLERLGPRMGNVGAQIAGGVLWHFDAALARARGRQPQAWDLSYWREGVLGTTRIYNYIGNKELKTLAQDAVIDRSPAANYAVP